MVYFYEIIFIVLSYIALHKDENHNLKSASFYFNVKKKSTCITVITFLKLLWVLLSACNKFKCPQVSHRFQSFDLWGGYIWYLEIVKKVTGSDIQWVGRVTELSGKSLVFRRAILPSLTVWWGHFTWTLCDLLTSHLKMRMVIPGLPLLGGDCWSTWNVCAHSQSNQSVIAIDSSSQMFQICALLWISPCHCLSVHCHSF